MNDLRLLKYEIIQFLDLQSINRINDNIDVHVRFENELQYTATFYTVDNIRSLMKKFKQQQRGECANGLYFWSPNMIVVDYLSVDVIQKTVSDLIQTETFLSVFSGPNKR